MQVRDPYIYQGFKIFEDKILSQKNHPEQRQVSDTQ